MTLELSSAQTRLELFAKVEALLQSHALRIHSQDLERPWGGFFAIEEAQALEFARRFFPEITPDQLRLQGRLSPKILMVEPGKKLSWQYHHRRSEIWKTLSGPVGVFRSPTDQQGPMQVVHEQESIELATGERHRLVGLETWGIVAEIWVHTEPSDPSDESDIVRLEDDFGR